MTDHRGFVADELSLSLDDADGSLELPARGAVLRVALGRDQQLLYVMGEFTVDQLEYSGCPWVLSIKASSADFRNSLSARKEKSWHDTNLGEIVTTMDSLNNLTASVGGEVRNIKITHIDQTGESDGSFLTRLARLYGAIASVKMGSYCF